MNKDNLRKATEALRSDKYRQITGYARTDEGFCAYGVMADVSGVGTWEKTPEGYYTYGGRTGTGVADLDRWYGTEHGFSYVHDEDGNWVSIMALNDDRGYDFHQIAALIEKEYEL